MFGLSRSAIWIGFAVHTLLCVSAAFAQSSAPGGDWVKKTPLPSPRNETALAAVQGKIYVLGGSVGGVGSGGADVQESPAGS